MYDQATRFQAAAASPQLKALRERWYVYRSFCLGAIDLRETWCIKTFLFDP